MAVQRIGCGPAVDVLVAPAAFATACDVEATLRPGIPDVDERLVCASLVCRAGAGKSGAACLECSHYRGWRDGPGLAQVTIHCGWSSSAFVSECMTPADELAVVPPEMHCADAEARARAADVHHLVVMHDDLLAGILCRCDLFPAPRRRQRVAERMTSPVYAITPDSALGEAAAAMSSLGVGCLPVLDDGRLVGLVTRADLGRIGVPEALLGAKRCVQCGSRHGVRSEPHYGLNYCLDCIELIDFRSGHD